MPPRMLAHTVKVRAQPGIYFDRFGYDRDCLICTADGKRLGVLDVQSFKFVDGDTPVYAVGTGDE